MIYTLFYLLGAVWSSHLWLIVICLFQMVDFETAARKVAASHPILFLRKFFFRSLLWKLVFTRSISINVRSFNYKRLLI